jgi:NodT family efflux transporter outer membrane factor (OMF) lipoprotein
MLKLTSSVALAALLAASCTTGPDFKRPEAPAVSGYAMAGDAQPANAVLSPETRAAGPWWTALGSSELDRLIRSALADSPDIAYAEANLRSALAEAGAVSGERSLQADVRAGAQRERINTQSFGFTGFPSPTINLYELGLSTRYDLDIFGKKRRASEAAIARAEAEQRRADAAYLTLSANVALQAVRIATLRAEIASVTATTQGDQRVLDMIARAQQAGGAPRSASSIGETQLAQDLALLPPLERQLAEARHQLGLLLGKSPAEWSAPDFGLTDFTAPASIPVAIPSQLVRKRPDILTAEAEFHAATADIGVATASLYPDISLTANILQGAIESETLFKYGSSGWSLAAGITGPLFHGGTLKAKEKQAIAEADAMYADYRRTVIRAFVQVSDILAGLAADDRSIAALERAEAAAQANYEDSRRAFELGAGPLLNIFDAGRQLNLAQRQKIEAQGQRLTDIIELFAATAADWR